MIVWVPHTKTAKVYWRKNRLTVSPFTSRPPANMWHDQPWWKQALRSWPAQRKDCKWIKHTNVRPYHTRDSNGEEEFRIERKIRTVCRSNDDNAHKKTFARSRARVWRKKECQEACSRERQADSSTSNIPQSIRADCKHTLVRSFLVPTSEKVSCRRWRLRCVAALPQSNPCWLESCPRQIFSGIHVQKGILQERKVEGVVELS